MFIRQEQRCLEVSCFKCGGGSEAVASINRRSIVGQILSRYGIKNTAEENKFICDCVFSRIADISDFALSLVVDDACKHYSIEISDKEYKHVSFVAQFMIKEDLAMSWTISKSNIALTQYGVAIISGVDFLHTDYVSYGAVERLFSWGSVILVDTEEEYILVNTKNRVYYILDTEFCVIRQGIVDKVFCTPTDFDLFVNRRNNSFHRYMLKLMSEYKYRNIFELAINTKDSIVCEFIKNNYMGVYAKIDDYVSEKYLLNRGIKSMCVDFEGVGSEDDDMSALFVTWASHLSDEFVKYNEVVGMRDFKDDSYVPDMVYNHYGECISASEDIIVSYNDTDDSRLVYFKKYKQVVVLSGYGEE